MGIDDKKTPCAVIRAIRHFNTITKHRHAVIRNCKKAGILWQGLFHDLSKYQPTEFFAGVKYYQGYRSPNEAERENIGASLAWMHHKGRNRHHFEYWTDYNPAVRGLIRPVKMPYRYIVEMFCDRLAAGKIYKKEKYTDSSPLEYFLPGKPKRTIHPETSDQLETLLTMLAEKGEGETFRYIRQRLREEKKKEFSLKDERI